MRPQDRKITAAAVWARKVSFFLQPLADKIKGHPVRMPLYHAVKALCGYCRWSIFWQSSITALSSDEIYLFL